MAAMLHTHERPETLILAAEHTDDIPLLIAHLRRIGIPQTIDAHIPTRAYWSNLSIGSIAAIWLAHILSQGDHKVKSVQHWVATRPETLRRCVGTEVLPGDVGDDRLRDILLGLSHNERWQAIETELNQRLWDHYAADAEQIRLNLHDSRLWNISPDGVLQVNQTPSWRPGMLRLHVMLATLDPYGLPLVVWSTTPHDKDGSPFANSIAHIQQSLPPRTYRFVGEGLAECAVRGMVHQQGNWYLCPLLDEPLPEQIQFPAESAPFPEHDLWRGHQELIATESPFNGHEWSVPMHLNLDDASLEWLERRILVRSRNQARLSEEALRTRMSRARLALLALSERKRGKRRPRTMAAMREAAEAIIDSYQVRGLLTLNFDEHVEERTVRRYRGRPTAVRVERDLQINITANDDAWSRTVRQLGWQIFGTNMTAEQRPPLQALLAASETERGFERLNGRPLSLLPHDLRREEYARGLVRLLLLGLRSLSLLETIAQTQLHAEGSMETNGRPMPHASSERLLDAFRDIMFTTGNDQEPHGMTPLSILQQRILNLVCLPADIYHGC